MLAGQDVTLDTLEENDKIHDLSFLAGETGIASDELTSFAISRGLPKSTDLPSEFWFAVLATKTIVPDIPPDDTAGVAGLVTSVLARVPITTAVSSVEAGLNAALARNLIDKKFKDDVPAWLKQYGVLAAREALKDGSSSNARDILTASGVPAAKRDAFVAAYLAGESHDDILARIKAGKEFQRQRVTAIAATLVVNDLTLGDPKLLVQLRKGVADPASAATLARMSQQDWLAALDRSGAAPPDFIAGDTPEAQRTNYAALLLKRAALTYPTAAFAGDLARTIDSKIKPAIPNAGQVLSFLDAHPDFELSTTAIESYMQQKARPEFFNAANKNDLVASLKAIQRVFKLAPNFTVTNSLLKDNLHSAQLIYRMGESQFVQKYSTQPGFTEAAARSVFQRAANTPRRGNHHCR